MEEKSEYTTYSSSDTNEALEQLAKKVVPKPVTTAYKTANKPKKVGELTAPDEEQLKSLSKGIVTDIADMESITEMLPEIERAMSILESAVLSPKDLLDPELMYRLSEHIDSDAANAFITIVTNRMNSRYNIDRKLPTILRDSLHRTGSYIIAVLPESSVDEVINSDFTLESEKYIDVMDRNGTPRPLGLLGHGLAVKDDCKSIAIESDNATGDVNEAHFKIHDNLHVYDNYDLLKIKQVREFNRSSSILNKIHRKSTIALESAEVDMRASKRIRRYAEKKFCEVKGLATDDTTVGGPLIMNLPSESVIPVHMTGDVTQHVGYFVLLDSNGSPITIRAGSTQYQELMKADEKDSDASTLIKQTRTALGLNSRGSNSGHDKFSTYIELVERDLMKRLENGEYENEVSIAKNEVVYRIMMQRALKYKKTSLLFLPAELVTYFAFDYDANGIGKSRLAGGKILASMRSVLLFANMTAAIKNSVPNSKLQIQLDPEDDDPQGTVNDIVEEFIKHSTGGISTRYTLNAADITRFLQKAGVTVEVEGNEKYPGTKVALEDSQRSVPEPDQTLDENLAKRLFMKMGLSPEIVDSSMDAEFATTVVANNLLLSKLASGIQRTFLEHCTNFTRQVILADGDFITELRDAIKEVKGIKPEDVDSLMYELIYATEARLPSAETSKFETQMEAFLKYKEAVEEGVNAYISEDMVSDFLDTDLADGVAPTITAIKGYFLRQWLQRENIMPELAVLEDIGGEGLDVAKVHAELLEGAVKNFGALFAKLRRIDRDEDNKRTLDINKSDRDLEQDEAKQQEKWDEEDNPAPEAEELDQGDSIDPVEETPTDDNVPGSEEGVEPDLDNVEETPDPENTDNVDDDDQGDGLDDFNFDIPET